MGDELVFVADITNFTEIITIISVHIEIIEKHNISKDLIKSPQVEPEDDQNDENNNELTFEEPKTKDLP